MHSIPDRATVLARLLGWAEQQASVRAMLLTSTRARPNAAVDIFSDYDVVLVVAEVEPLFADRSWLEAFGEPLVVYWDPLFEGPSGFRQTGNVAYFVGGLHIDFGIWPVAVLQQLVAASELPAELDAGYTILLDKDQLTAGLRAPSYRGYIPPRPSEETYQTVVNDFWSDAPYVAKCLWRDELLPAKWCLDFDMKHVFLRQMLEWRVAGQHGWSVPVGNLGRGLKKLLPPPIWAELEQTYAGAGIEENWEALFRTLTLFRRVGQDVAAELGYTYPLELDRRVTALVRAIQETPR